MIASLPMYLAHPAGSAALWRYIAQCLRRAGVERPDKANAAALRKANTDAGLDPDFDRAGLQSLKSLNRL